MGLATEQLSQQLLEYEKKVSMSTIINVVSSTRDVGDISPSRLLFKVNFLTAGSLNIAL